MDLTTSDYRALYTQAARKMADEQHSRRIREERRRREDAERLRREKAERAAAALLASKRAAIAAQLPRLERRPRRFTYGLIERRIAAATGIPIKDIRGKRRSKALVFARQAISYWSIRLTDLSYPQIGRLMGGRDHTTILHGVKAYARKRASQGKIRRVPK